MGVFLAVITYFAYLFIIAMYTAKVVKFMKTPLHLRWDLYPVLHEEHWRYGGSYYEGEEWWSQARPRNRLRGFFHLLGQNFYLGDYFRCNRRYWLALYPWHLGFILIIAFHIFCFISAVAILLGLSIGPDASGAGAVAYYVVLLTGVASFILGAAGSAGLLIERLTDKDLRRYAAPLNYLNYVFFLMVFLSGLYAWIFSDPTFSGYREYWKALVSLNAPHVDAASGIHILLFSLFLIYLPYTRSMHYISRFLAYFKVRWDDEPNLPGSCVEKEIGELLKTRVSWSAAHIRPGRTWADVAANPGDEEKK
jgi:nitrate reductase gamma subunit